jgi:hypothetical protein
VTFAILNAYGIKIPRWMPVAMAITRALFQQCYFDDKVCKQSNGIAMGTNAAPDIANCYLAPIEKYLSEKLGSRLFLYKRFIDDGFAIVDNEETAQLIIRELQNRSHLKLTWELSDLSAHFLDLEVYKGALSSNTGLLCFRTFRKTMNKFLYLPAFSSHHPATVKSWVFAEILRLRNTSLLDDDFLSATKFFLQQLRCRGYSSMVIQSALDMLPADLFSPFTRVRKYVLSPLIDNSGQVMVNTPPLIFRAPFALQHNIKYGPILNDGFEELLQQLLGARVANPNPIRSQLLMMANTLAKSLSDRLVRAEYRSKPNGDKMVTNFQNHNF